VNFAASVCQNRVYTVEHLQVVFLNMRRRLIVVETISQGTLDTLLVHARAIFAPAITPARVEHLKRTLPAKERQQLLKDLRLAPAWMHALFHELAGN
jgi:hypothetical protein